MRSFRRSLPFFLLGTLPVSVFGGDILSTEGFSTCVNDPSIKVQALNVQYDRSNRRLTFDVAGSSAEQQKVLLNLVVSAYGKEVYTKEFNPCDSETANVTDMCPGMSV